LRYRGDCTTICDEAYIQEKFGIHPSQYACFKSLVGDTADHIQGIAKVGPKTAADLLSQFGSLEALLERWEEIEKPTIRASIGSSLERLKDNYTIISLEGDVPLPYDVEALTYSPTALTTREVLTGIGIY
jgi:DNA polymerase-1